ncbi:MAG: carbon-nitrogen hydrolase family protein [Candidatus Latescibacteria bacterium]|nr:carbon-nitrogen hydrolase family protein [Candidatus Latescibacterota bacterium]
MKIALIQPSFISTFPEKLACIRNASEYTDSFTPEDATRNLDIFLGLVRESAEKGAELAVGPESLLDGWSYDRNALEYSAVPLDSPEIGECCSAAGDYGIWICAGVFTRRDGVLANSSLLISPEGEMAGVYDKVHETPEVLGEMGYSLGDSFPVFDTPFGKAGMLICHDRWYPEAFRSLAVGGARLVLNPVATAICHPSHEWYDMHTALLRTRAYENRVTVVTVNASNHGGHSRVIGPDGAVIFEAPLETGAYVVDVAPDTGAGYDFLKSRRPDAYVV